MILENVEIYWAKLDPNNPDMGFDGNSPQWNLQARTRDKAVSQEWKKLGLNVNVADDDDGVFYRITLKKPTMNNKGQPNKPVPVVGPDLMPFDDVSIIGNGSIANINVHSFDYNFNGRTGVGFRLNAVQVVKLNRYERKSGELNMGFKVLEVPNDVDDDEAY